jgi:acetyltransferase-like isoleucine patch superfamily enzyme
LRKGGALAGVVPIMVPATLLRLALSRLRTRGRVRATGRVRIGPGVRFHLTPGSRLTLGDGCRIGAGTRFHVHGHASVGAGATLGERCVIAVEERVEIGDGARLEDEVVLIDFDHDLADVERPIRLQGMLTAPVVIGAHASLEAGSTVLRGVVVGERARVQPRGVVTRDVPPGVTVGGVPARIVAGGAF